MIILRRCENGKFDEELSDQSHQSWSSRYLYLKGTISHWRSALKLLIFRNPKIYFFFLFFHLGSRILFAHSTKFIIITESHTITVLSIYAVKKSYCFSNFFFPGIINKFDLALKTFRKRVLIHFFNVRYRSINLGILRVKFKVNKHMLKIQFNFFVE